MAIDDDEFGPPPLSWRQGFPPYEKSVPLARHVAAQVLIRWGCTEDDVAAAVLIIGELAANAVRHAHVPGEPFAVALKGFSEPQLVRKLLWQGGGSPQPNE